MTKKPRLFRWLEGWVTLLSPLSSNCGTCPKIADRECLAPLHVFMSSCFPVKKLRHPHKSPHSQVQPGNEGSLVSLGFYKFLTTSLATVLPLPHEVILPAPQRK